MCVNSKERDIESLRIKNNNYYCTSGKLWLCKKSYA